MPEHQSRALTLRLAHAQAIGEPYITGFRQSELRHLLERMGYALLDDLSPVEQTARFFQHREDGMCPSAYWHWAHARLV